jgi:rubredoxin
LCLARASALATMLDVSSITFLDYQKQTMTQVDPPYRTFMCVVCGLLYNEAEGWPDDNIAPGTRWEDVPETWTCPDCGVTKSDFEMIEV